MDFCGKLTLERMLCEWGLPHDILSATNEASWNVSFWAHYMTSHSSARVIAEYVDGLLLKHDFRATICNCILFHRSSWRSNDWLWFLMDKHKYILLRWPWRIANFFLSVRFSGRHHSEVIGHYQFNHLSNHFTSGASTAKLQSTELTVAGVEEILSQ